ncbi:MAG TPA: ParB/RepB/Spo0J family partition protein [Chloroflexota bacterium]|nr:ParB/RepB/Spo0J family partition protein [Chloroflexota bacterium]
MSEKRVAGPRVPGRSSGPRISAAQPTTPPTQVQLGHDRLLAGAREVDIAQLRADPAQPRQSMNPERLAELAGSIVSYGLLQPLVVRQDGLGQDGDMRYTVIAGGRRYAAIQMALAQATSEEVRRRLVRVPVVVTDSAAVQERVIQLIENLQREDLSAVEEARALKEVMQLQGLSMDALAARIHRSQGYVDERLRLLRHEEIEAAVEAGTITKSAGAAIASIRSAASRQEWLERAQQGETIRPRDIYASKTERRHRGRSDADTVSETPGTGSPTEVASAPARSGGPVPGSAANTGTRDDARAAALRMLNIETARALREHWQAADQQARQDILRKLLDGATPGEQALLARTLALGALLALSCEALLTLLEER